MRHQYTNYDERLNNLELGYVDGELKHQVREEVAGRIESKLAQWRGDDGALLSANLPDGGSQ